MITGQTLIDWGFTPGKWFGDVLSLANQMKKEGSDDEFLRAWISAQQPVMPQHRKLLGEAEQGELTMFLAPDTPEERANCEAAAGHMRLLMETPTIKAGALMPDACPAGSAPGTIPVGGVVACEDAIHPGFHSADICCSMAFTELDSNVDHREILDAAIKVSHFGPGGRFDARPAPAEMPSLFEAMENNPFTKGLHHYALNHFMTQGDGNHFFFVGKVSSTGRTAIVTHHGSRGLGAQLYKRGKLAAEKHTAMIAPEVPAHNAWIKASSQAGEDYWDALQLVRRWTKLNHFAIHDAVLDVIGARPADRFWNEHNFVFQKSDGLFYHAKGATPSYEGFAHDSAGLALIPMNMGRPILITEPMNRRSALGFAPHGAGRNLSRTKHIKALSEAHGDSRDLSPDAMQRIIAAEVGDYDIRAFNGKIDLSELPSAYKDAGKIKAAIEDYDLARIVDRVLPLGSIMAGEAVNWKQKKEKKA